MGISGKTLTAETTYQSCELNVCYSRTYSIKKVFISHINSIKAKTTATLFQICHFYQHHFLMPYFKMWIKIHKWKHWLKIRLKNKQNQNRTSCLSVLWSLSLWQQSAENNHFVQLSPSNQNGQPQEKNHLSQRLKSVCIYLIVLLLNGCIRVLKRANWIMDTLRTTTSFSDWRVIWSAH